MQEVLSVWAQRDEAEGQGSQQLRARLWRVCGALTGLSTTTTTTLAEVRSPDGWSQSPSQDTCAQPWRWTTSSCRRFLTSATRAKRAAGKELDWVALRPDGWWTGRRPVVVKTKKKKKNRIVLAFLLKHCCPEWKRTAVATLWGGQRGELWMCVWMHLFTC